MLMKYPVVLTIAGSDSSGGAGIQADIKTMSALGVYSASAITAITAQNTMGVTDIQGINPSTVSAQIDVVFNDINPIAVKIGMLFSEEIVDVVYDRLRYYNPRFIVLDPVMISTSGKNLISENAIRSIIEKLIPISTIITPNKFEAIKISDIELDNEADIESSAKKILNYGCKYVLIKGGHFEDNTMTDYLYSRQGLVRKYTGHRVNTVNTHGTGCTLSSAIASYLALGFQMETAVGNAKKYLQSALEAGANIEIGTGHGPVNHFYNPHKLEIL